MGQYARTMMPTPQVLLCIYHTTNLILCALRNGISSLWQRPRGVHTEFIKICHVSKNY